MDPSFISSPPGGFPLPPPPVVVAAEIPCAEKIANCHKIFGLLPIVGTVVGICALVTICRKDEPTKCGRVAEAIAQIFSFTVLPSIILGFVYMGQAIANCCCSDSKGTEEIILPPPPSTP